MRKMIVSRSTATISECRRYRYALKRVWDTALPTALFVMLNPSTADETQDDPTIRRCIGFAHREGCGGLTVVNLYAFRATKPADMWAAADPVGPLNASHHAAALKQCFGPVIAAWGATGNRDGMGDEFLRHAEAADRQVVCLGLTKSGDPRHPLYVKGDAPLQPLKERSGV